jgi:predicted membrane channel-forming protein YqfA (hemolysin III family)
MILLLQREIERDTYTVTCGVFDGENKKMRAKLTTSLGYSLLIAAAVAGVIYAKTSLDFSEIAQFAVFAAGALALLVMTSGRRVK